MHLQRSLKTSSTQTDPVQDEAFDWDLSDKTEVETQTVPPSRSNSVNSTHRGVGGGVGGGGGRAEALLVSLVDAICQTDQRLAFLLKRSAAKKAAAASKAGGTPSRIRHHDAWCQTYIEVTEIGVQCSPSEFDSEESSESQDSPQTSRELTLAEIESRRRQQLEENHSVCETPLRQVKRVLVLPEGGGLVDSEVFSHLVENDVAYSDYDSGSGRSSEKATAIGTRGSAATRGVTSANSFRTQSDAGFQVNLAQDAGIVVARRANRSDISSPVRGSLLRSLNYLDSQNEKGVRISGKEFKMREAKTNGGKKKGHTTARPQTVKEVAKVDIAVQTENDIITDVSSTYKAVPSVLRKYELIGDDPDVFTDIDEFVHQMTLSGKTYKSLKSVVKRLLSRIEGVEAYEGREDLFKVRAFFRWVTENIV